ncbi:MAG: hypothetical protein ACTHZW_01980 [Microbacteriaceae bacterium]
MREPEPRPTIDELIELGQVRPALHGPEKLRDFVRSTLPGRMTTADVIADVRGYERDY